MLVGLFQNISVQAHLILGLLIFWLITVSLRASGNVPPQVDTDIIMLVIGCMSKYYPSKKTDQFKGQVTT